MILLAALVMAWAVVSYSLMSRKVLPAGGAAVAFAHGLGVEDLCASNASAKVQSGCRRLQRPKVTTPRP